MVGWIAAGAIFAVTCFASKRGHKNVPLIGAMTAAAVLWTCKLFKKPSSNGGSSCTQDENLEDDHKHALEFPPESDNQVRVLPQSWEPSSIKDTESVQLISSIENSSIDHNKEMFSEIVNELQPSDAFPDNKKDILEDGIENELNDTTLGQSKSTPSSISTSYNLTKAGEIGYSSSSKRSQLDDEFNNVDDEFNKQSSSEQFVAPMELSAIVENVHQDEKADPSSVWKFLDSTDATEIYMNKDNSKNVLQLISIPSIELEDALTLSGATCSSKSSVTSPTLAIINPNTLEGISLDTQIGPWAEERSAQVLILPHADSGANSTEMKDVQLCATSIKLVSLATSLESDDNTTQGALLTEPSSLPFVQDKAGDHEEASVLSEIPLAIKVNYFVQNVDIICDQTEVATQLTVSKVSALTDYFDLPSDYNSISQDGSRNVHVSTVPDPIISTSSFSSITPEARLAGELDPIICTTTSSDHPEARIIAEGRSLDHNLVDALDTSEKPLTNSLGNMQDSIFEDSILQDLSFRYGVNGDADIFDILSSPAYSAAPEKSLMLDALDEGTFNLWTSNVQISRRSAASTSSSVKSMIRQEVFRDSLSAISDVNVDPLYALQRPTSAASFASGEDLGDTISFKTAQSFESRSNSIISGKSTILAEKPRWLASSGEDDTASLQSPSGSISDPIISTSSFSSITPAKRLPTVSTTVNSSTEEKTPIHTPRLEMDFGGNASNFSGAADTMNFVGNTSNFSAAADTMNFLSNKSNFSGAVDAMNTPRRPYPDRANTYDQYLSDPKLPLQMRYQVMRAKATLEKYYETKKNVDMPSSVELGKS